MEKAFFSFHFDFARVFASFVLFHGFCWNCLEHKKWVNKLEYENENIRNEDECMKMVKHSDFVLFSSVIIIALQTWRYIECRAFTWRHFGFVLIVKLESKWSYRKNTYQQNYSYNERKIFFFFFVIFLLFVSYFLLFLFSLLYLILLSFRFPNKKCFFFSLKCQRQMVENSLHSARNNKIEKKRGKNE